MGFPVLWGKRETEGLLVSTGSPGRPAPPELPVWRGSVDVKVWKGPAGTRALWDLKESEALRGRKETPERLVKMV